MDQQVGGGGSQERIAGAFFFAHDLFRIPSAEQWRHLQSSRTREIWAGLCELLQIHETMRLPDSAEVFEEEYAEAFGSDGNGGRIPLRESSYQRREPPEKVAEANLAFYQALGLNPRVRGTESSDHLRAQLEFIGFLCRLEGRVVQESRVEGPPPTVRTAAIRRARREFLQRHLLSWLPAAAARARQGSTAWVRAFLVMTVRLVEEMEASDVGPSEG